jgi:hypothetical protein
MWSYSSSWPARVWSVGWQDVDFVVVVAVELPGSCSILVSALAVDVCSEDWPIGRVALHDPE